jgi:transcriptional regulator with XRE-family HTH domain
MGRTSAQQKLAKKLKQLRKEKNWSQVRLAFEAKLDRSYISNIETARSNPSLKTIQKLAKALGVSTSDLIGP